MNRGRRAAETEDLIASLAALGIMILPLSEVVLRRFFNTGVPGAAPFTAHLTLIVGLVGAAIAAREGKLLALATGTMLPEGRPRHVAGILAAFVGALVTTILALGGVRLLQVHREAGEGDRARRAHLGRRSRVSDRVRTDRAVAWSGSPRRR